MLLKFRENYEDFKKFHDLCQLKKFELRIEIFLKIASLWSH